MGHRPEPRTPGSGGPPADFRLDRVAGRRQAPFAESAAGTGHSALRIDAQGRRLRRPTWLAGPPHLKGDACVAPTACLRAGLIVRVETNHRTLAGPPLPAHRPADTRTLPGCSSAPAVGPHRSHSARESSPRLRFSCIRMEGGVDGAHRCVLVVARRGWRALVPTGCGCLGACIPPMTPASTPVVPRTRRRAVAWANPSGGGHGVE